MKTILALLLVTLNPLAAHAEDCGVQMSDLSSKINVSSALVKTKGKVNVSRRMRSLTQTNVLKDETAVTYTVGGCQHYSYSFAYAGLEASEGAVAKLNAAIKALTYTPVTEAGTNEKGILLLALVNALQNQPEEQDGIINLPCGDASCSLTKLNGKTVISYSFAI